MTTTQLQPGAIVRVRPYVREEDGHGNSRPVRRPYREAIVLGDFMDRPALWFSTLGDPHEQDVIQPLYRDMEHHETGKDIVSLPAARLRQLDRAIGRAERTMSGTPLGDLLHARRMQIQSALRAHAQVAHEAEAALARAGQVTR